MRFRRICYSAVLCCLASSSTGLASDMGLTDGFRLNEREAVWLAPPVLVAAPDVHEAVWSPDGQSLVLLQHRMRLTSSQWRATLRAVTRQEKLPPGDLVVGVWRKDSSRYSEVLKLPLGQAMIQDLGWMPASTAALAKVMRFEGPVKNGEAPVLSTQLYRIDAETGRADAVSDPLANADSTLSVSPTVPLAVFQTSPSRLILVGPKGRPMHVAIPEGVVVGAVGWTSGGAEAYITTADTRQPTYYLLSAAGSLTRLDAEPRSSGAHFSTPRPFLLTSGKPMKVGGLALSSRPVWLTVPEGTEESRALVSADGRNETLSPGCDSVYYVSSGAGFVRQVVRMPLGEYEAVEMARRAAIQAHITNQAKQAALALIMYASDHEEVLPGSQVGLPDELQPYLKGDAAQGILDGLVYTYQGRTLADAQDPGSTELGYIPGPSGRAVLYVDGHVEWKDGEAAPR